MSLGFDLVEDKVLLKVYKDRSNHLLICIFLPALGRVQLWLYNLAGRILSCLLRNNSAKLYNRPEYRRKKFK